jgi:hypothetical protein
MIKLFTHFKTRSQFLDIQKVTEELEMLKAFCGADLDHALIKIDWDLDFTFANGFKAPPWRQIYGELSYLSVQCHDKDAFIITASKKGYFINKGYSNDAAGKIIIKNVNFLKEMRYLIMSQHQRYTEV